MKKLTRIVCIFLLIFLAGCKGYSLDSVPYLISGKFVMEDNSSDYSICGAEIYLLNKSQKEVKAVNIIFYLFDKDGEPACECRNKISVEMEKELSAGEDSSFCISLDTYMNSIPEDLLQIDYLYIARIEYEDGSLWEDPFGLVAFN